MEQAVREIQRALELDPLNLKINNDSGMILYFDRKYETAIEQLRRTLDLDPRYYLAHNWLGASYMEQGMLGQSLAEAEKAEPVMARPLLRAIVYARTGKKGEARKILAELKERYARSYYPPAPLAWSYVALGENKQAIEWLERAYKEGDWFAYWSKVAPWLDPLRTDPRFQDLLRRMNFPQ